MTQKYLDKLTEMFNHINSKTIKNYQIRHFFNGAAVYVKGKICISLSPAGFAIKLPEEVRDKLKGKPLRYFAKGHIKKEYMVLPKRILSDKRLLTQLIKKSFEYVVLNK